MTEPAEESIQPSLVPRPTGLGVDLRGTVLDGCPFILSGEEPQTKQIGSGRKYRIATTVKAKYEIE